MTPFLLRILISWAVLCALPAFALTPYRPVHGDALQEPWRWRTFLEMNGLDAQCLAQTMDGSIWFGTADGVCSYDGFSWKRYLQDATPGNDIPCGGVNAVCGLPDGTLTAGGWWGISQLKNGKWIRLVPSPGLRFADVRRLVTGADGSLWAATSWGALHRKGDRWILYTDRATGTGLRNDGRYQELQIELIPDTVLLEPRKGHASKSRTDLAEVAVDSAGGVWLATRGGEVLRLDTSRSLKRDPADSGEHSPDAWTLFNELDGLECGGRPVLLPLQGGAVWYVGAPSQQVSIFEGDSWRTLPIPAPGIASDGAKLIQTRDEKIWLSTKYRLLSYHQGEWTTYQRPAVPLPEATNLLMQSLDGALWIVGPNTDVKRVDYQTTRWLTLQDLNFQWESPEGTQWFINRKGQVVMHQEGKWLVHGVEDGVIDTPVALHGTRKGIVWVAGSHGGTAATAYWDGTAWHRTLHAELAWGIDWRGIFESSNGTLWFGAAVDSSGPKQHRHGMLSYRDGKWQHHYQAPRGAGAAATGDTMFMLPPGHRPEPVEKYLAIGESRDGRIWSGRNVLSFFDGTKWEELFPSGEVRFGIIECMYTSREGDLWIGTRQNGALRFDGREWKQFQGPESMVANTVRSVVQGSDNTLWFATDRGTSRFDGITWMEDVLPGELTLQNEAGELKASSGGKVWINRRPPEWNRRGWAKSPPLSPDGTFSTTCHECGGPAPDTHIVAGMDTVSQPGNLSVLWRGAVPWCDPRDARLQYSWSLDEGPWSPFSPQHSQAFFSLPSGPHRLQVRARDQDFTVDPTPATMSFVVLPPVWRQPWFIALITILVGGVLAQTVRVLIKQGHLKRAHAELEDRVRQRTAELEATNRELEAFSYSVSHDLRAPLRRIEGFSQVLLEEHAAALNEEGKYFLNRVCNSAHQMGGLIEALLKMARITRGQMQLVTVDLSQMAHEIADELLQRDPSRKVVFSISPGLKAQADQLLIRAALMNLLENAWKYTSKCAEARIEVGRDSSTEHHEFFVRDNGVGFDPKNAGRLFGAFQRLHKAEEFPGTGVGLATVQRIIHRHGGSIRAEATPGKGAVFLFTLGATHENHPGPHADRTGA